MRHTLFFILFVSISFFFNKFSFVVHAKTTQNSKKSKHIDTKPKPIKLESLEIKKIIDNNELSLEKYNYIINVTRVLYNKQKNQPPQKIENSRVFKNQQLPKSNFPILILNQINPNFIPHLPSPIEQLDYKQFKKNDIIIDFEKNDGPVNYKSLSKMDLDIEKIENKDAYETYYETFLRVFHDQILEELN